MITGAIISFFGSFILSMILLLPVSNAFPTEINTSINAIFQFAYSWNWIVPVDTVVQILSITMSIYTAIFAFKGLKWILNLFRGSGA